MQPFPQALDLQGPTGEQAAPDAAPIAFINEETGEVIDGVDQEVQVVDLSVTGLTAYARKRTEMDAARVKLGARIDALIAADKEVVSLRKEVADIQVSLSLWEESLAQAFTPEVRRAHGHGIVLDVGAVRVCWPKVAERTTQKVKPADILRTDPALAQRLGIETKHDAPRAPIITIRGDKLAEATAYVFGGQA